MLSSIIFCVSLSAIPALGCPREQNRATLVTESADRPVSSRDLAGTVAHAGVDPTFEGRALQDALRRAIDTRRGSCYWTVDHAGWVVTLLSPEQHDFYGKTRAFVLARHLVWLMRPERAVAPLLALAPHAAGCGHGAR
jgi:hypothetical protein